MTQCIGERLDFPLLHRLGDCFRLDSPDESMLHTGGVGSCRFDGYRRWLQSTIIWVCSCNGFLNSFVTSCVLADGVESVKDYRWNVHVASCELISHQNCYNGGIGICKPYTSFCRPMNGSVSLPSARFMNWLSSERISMVMLLASAPNRRA